MSAAGSHAAEVMINLITGGWRAQCIYAATKMRIPDLIARGTKTPQELAKLTDVAEDRLYRLMRVLVAIQVFEDDDHGGYRNTALSTLLMDTDGSLRDMIMFCGEEFYLAWSRAYESIRTGTSGFELHFDHDFYEFLRLHPEIAQRFNLAMKANNVVFREIPDLIVTEARHVVDLGGGHGELLKAILTHDRSVRATLLDRENMLAFARPNLREFVGQGRVSFVAGDMHDTVPAGADIYLLSRVVSDISDEQAVRIFDNCRRTMREDGRIVIIERMIPSDDATSMTALWDVHLSMISGGRYRTTDHIEELLGRAGLRIEHRTVLPMDMYFVSAVAGRVV